MEPIRILLLEDSPIDAELVTRLLTRSSLDVAVKRVAAEPNYRRELAAGRPDVILADFNLPGFDGMSALRIARSLVPDVPFIFVSGSIGEERAVQALREGASDYILKDRPARLPAAIERAIADRREAAERRRMTDALLASERRFHLALMATRDVIWDYDVSRQVAWFNSAMEHEWGYALDGEIDAEWWLERMHPEDRLHVQQTFEQSLRATDGEQWSAEYRFRRADGAYGNVYDRWIVERADDGAPIRVIGAMQDITQRVEDYQEIRRLNDHNRMILENVGDGIIGADTDAVITFANPASRKIMGWTTEVSGVGLSHEVMHVHGLCDDTCAIRLTLRDGQPREGERTLARATGQPISVEFCCNAVIDAGRIVGCVVTFRDVTERNRLRHQLEQSQRVTNLGQVAATIVHEFNNVLMGIQPFAEVIRRGASDERHVRAASQIITCVARGRKVTEDILRTTQARDPALRAADVCDWLRQIERELVAITGDGVTIEMRLPSRPLFARCDPEQMQQVILNLALNARDAMNGAGTITIEASTPPSDDGFVVLNIRDTGSGIPPEVRPHIFEPLFTTKRTGTGLGLAVAHQVVTRSGGTIDVDSTVGEGTVFRITLPAAPAPAATAATAAAPRPAVVRLLIVDDDMAIADGLSELLELDGIHVSTVTLGGKALDAIRATRPDAVVLDVTLPDMPGTEVYERIAERWPDLPVIFATGNSDTSMLEFVAAQNVAFLRKPYDAETLMNTLSRIV